MSEFDLIARLRSAVDASAEHPGRVRIGSGDDAAVTVPGGATATSVDSLVEGVHFRREDFSLADVGHKAMAAALSDLAAMGAEAGEAYVQLGVPRGFGGADAEELAGGLAACAGAAGAAVLGGDVARAPVLWIGVTVVGHAARAENFVTRGGAGVGDILAVTGELGGAGAGLLLLERPELGDALDAATAAALRARQRRPQPRLAAGRALAGAGATAMIDLSDGLAGDAGHLAAASDVRVAVALERLPVAAGVEAVARAAGQRPEAIAAGAGEDYELLAALPEASLAAARAAVEETGSSLTVIGAIVPGTGRALSLAGEEQEIEGFDQLLAGGSPAGPS